MAIECDVLVVGAGPAGSSAARACASSGIRTLLVDKKMEIGHPVQCAEGIGDYLFPYLPFTIPQKQLIWRIKGMLFWADGIFIKREGNPWSGYSINRRDFDKWLAWKAIKAGANLFLDTELIDLTLDRNNNVRKAIIRRGKRFVEIMPKIIIAADGSESKVLRLLGLYSPKEGDIGQVKSYKMVNLKIENPHYEQFYFGDFAPRAYAYLFPLSKTKANIGVGTTLSDDSLDELFHSFLDFEFVRRQLEGGKIEEERSGKAVVRDLTDKWVYGNVALVGDAANQNIKPFIEGILPAIICGDILGKLVSRSLRQGTPLTDEMYKKAVYNKIGRFLVNQEVTNFVYNLPSCIESRSVHLLYLGIFSGIIKDDDLKAIIDLGYDPDFIRNLILRSRER